MLRAEDGPAEQFLHIRLDLDTCFQVDAGEHAVAQLVQADGPIVQVKDQRRRAAGRATASEHKDWTKNLEGKNGACDQGV